MQPKAKQQPLPLLPDEPEDIRADVHELLENADVWLQTPNNLLGGQKPEDLIGTEREDVLRQMLQSFRLGMFS